MITLHVPLNKGTKDLITSNHFAQMKPDVCLVNVARGGIVNEEHLYQFLSENEKASAAIDVFECEPYTGNLLALNNVVVTPHLGSMTFDCRGRMEEEATEEVIRYLRDGEQNSPVPSEYFN